MEWLTEKELCNICTYKQKSKQISWLKRQGIRHLISASGHPRVLQSWVENYEKQGVSGPNLEAVRRLRRV